MIVVMLIFQARDSFEAFISPFDLSIRAIHYLLE